MLSNFIKPAVAAVMAISTALSVAILPHPVMAQGAADPLNTGGLNPEGIWESESGDSRYDVRLCGPDGVSLCGELIWIRERDRNERNVKFLNETVIDTAQRTRPLEWKGRLNVYGTEYGGTVKMIDRDTLRLTACVFILCESQEYVRVENPDGSRVNTAETN